MAEEETRYLAIQACGFLWKLYLKKASNTCSFGLHFGTSSTNNGVASWNW